MQLTLRDILSPVWFKSIESRFLSRYGMKLETVNSDGKRIIPLSSRQCYPGFCQLVRESRPAIERCGRDRIKWIQSASINGTIHIGTCHAGIVMGCVPVVYRGKRLGGLFFGKCLLRKADNHTRQELHRRFRRYGFFWSLLYDGLDQMQIVNRRQIVRAGHYLQAELKKAILPGRAAKIRRQKLQNNAKREKKRQRLNKPINSIKPQSRLAPAIELMNYHYDLPLKLKDIAAIAGLSKFHFSHVFRNQMGLTPVEYLTRVRIEHAKRLLTTTDWKARQIMESIGYMYQSYYVRMFKRVAGMTPEQYRRIEKRPSGTARSAKTGIFRKPER